MSRRTPSRRPGSSRPGSPQSGAAASGGGRKRSTRSGPPPKRKRSKSGSPRSRKPADGVRLQKVLAEAGLASRRQCEELILEGRVQVDGQIVTELGTRVFPVSQQIRIDGVLLSAKKKVYLMLHKPRGVVTSARDPSGRPRVVDMVPDEPRVFPVGRLDLHSEGLLLLTNDGDLANALTHPRFHVEKVYRVVVAGEMTTEKLSELKRGVYLAEGLAKVEGARIISSHKHSTVLEMVLTEGKNREIRRVLARQGNKVQSLRRISVGGVKLGDLPSGAYRPLRPQELRRLQETLTIAEETASGEEAVAEAPAESRPPRKKKSDFEKSGSGRTGGGNSRSGKPSGKSPAKKFERSEGKSSGQRSAGNKPRGKSHGKSEHSNQKSSNQERSNFSGSQSLGYAPSSGMRIGTTIGEDEVPHIPVTGDNESSREHSEGEQSTGRQSSGHSSGRRSSGRPSGRKHSSKPQGGKGRKFSAKGSRRESSSEGSSQSRSGYGGKKKYSSSRSEGSNESGPRSGTRKSSGQKRGAPKPSGQKQGGPKQSGQKQGGPKKKVRMARKPRKPRS